MPTFFEFFAGGGMVRAGLGEDWTCAFANDFDQKKCETYRRNWHSEIVCEDINKVALSALPRTPHLVWASFPCQDLSLAGGGAGLKGDRSGTFWPFWNLVRQMTDCGPGPDFIVLENVCGTLTSHDGSDFVSIVQAFRKIGYRVGAMVIDAERFVPQSRPRLFFICIPKDKIVPECALGDGVSDTWHPAALRRAYMRLDVEDRDAWLWWQLPAPPKRTTRFADIVEEQPTSVRWHTSAETRQLLQMMAPLHRKRLEQAKASSKRMVGTIYKRTRRNPDGNKIQRAEVRFDDVAGCLRTPAGGSSRQTLVIVEKNRVRSRLISARETARLMGLNDSYELPQSYNEAYHLTGDGVVVDVVRYLKDHIFSPTMELALARKVA